MANLSGLKPLTESDRKRMKDILTKNPSEQEFKKNMEKYERMMNREKRPWCRACSVRDFQERKEQLKNTLQQSLINPHKQVNKEELTLTLDYDKYWKGFVKISERKVLDRSFSGPGHTNPLIQFETFMCQNGHKISINMGQASQEVAKPTTPTKV